jgi:hypothetical protein
MTRFCPCWEQDETALGHVAVVAALSNLRCRTYGIKEIDTLQVQKVSIRFFRRAPPPDGFWLQHTPCCLRLPGT